MMRGKHTRKPRSALLALKIVALRLEFRLLRRAGLQPGHNETFWKRLWNLRGNARMFVGRGFSHDINAAE